MPTAGIYRRGVSAGGEPLPDFQTSSSSLSSMGEGCPGQPAVQTGGCPGRVALSSYVGLLCFAQFLECTQTPVCVKAWRLGLLSLLAFLLLLLV